jgi:hypothetical protein
MLMPMPDSIIKWVNRIGLRDKQGPEVRFLNGSKEPYSGLTLEKEAPFPDISAEIPGVPLEEEEDDIQIITNEPKPAFEMSCPITKHT